MDNVPKETHVVSVMTHWLLETVAKVRGKKGRSSSPASNSKAKQTDGEGQQSSNESCNEEESSLEKSEIPCRFKFCKNLSCKFWHPPLCQNYNSEEGCTYGDKCRFRHVEAEEKPSKKSKKGGAKGSVAISKESIQVGCVSLDSYPRKFILREQERWGSKHTVKISKGTWHHIKIGEKKKGPSRGIIQKCAPHDRSPCAPTFG